jgi:hypothetical protein
MDELRPGVGPERVTNGDRSGSAWAHVPDHQRPHHPARRGAGRAVRLLLGATLLAMGWVMLTALSSQAAETQHGRTLGGLTRALGPVSHPVRQVLGAADAATAGRSQHPAGRPATATRSSSSTPSGRAHHAGRPLPAPGAAVRALHPLTSPLTGPVTTGPASLSALMGAGLPLVDRVTSALPVKALVPVSVHQPVLPLRPALSALLSTAAEALPLTSPAAVVASAGSLTVDGPTLAPGRSTLSALSAGRHSTAGLRWPGRPGPIPAPEPSAPAGAVTVAAAGTAGWAAVALGGLGLGARGRARRVAPVDHRLPLSPAPRPGIRPA